MHLTEGVPKSLRYQTATSPSTSQTTQLHYQSRNKPPLQFRPNCRLYSPTRRSRQGPVTDSLLPPGRLPLEAGTLQPVPGPSNRLLNSSTYEVLNKAGHASTARLRLARPVGPGLLTLRGACATRSFHRRRSPSPARSRAPADTSRDAPSRKKGPRPNSSSQEAGPKGRKRRLQQLRGPLKLFPYGQPEMAAAPPLPPPDPLSSGTISPQKASNASNGLRL